MFWILAWFSFRQEAAGNHSHIDYWLTHFRNKSWVNYSMTHTLKQPLSSFPNKSAFFNKLVEWMIQMTNSCTTSCKLQCYRKMLKTFKNIELQKVKHYTSALVQKFELCLMLKFAMLSFSVLFLSLRYFSELKDLILVLCQKWRAF